MFFTVVAEMEIPLDLHGCLVVDGDFNCLYVYFFLTKAVPISASQTLM